MVGLIATGGLEGSCGSSKEDLEWCESSKITQDLGVFYLSFLGR